MSNIGFDQEKSTSMMSENQSAIELVKNPTHHPCTKHIGNQHHFICKKVEHGLIEMKCVYAMRIIANVLAKPLAKC